MTDRIICGSVTGFVFGLLETVGRAWACGATFLPVAGGGAFLATSFTCVPLTLTFLDVCPKLLDLGLIAFAAPDKLRI